MCVCAQLLQEDLEMEQVRVNSLTHMVVVVDENSGDSATADLEQKLQVTLKHKDTHTHACLLCLQTEKGCHANRCPLATEPRL